MLAEFEDVGRPGSGAAPEVQRLQALAAATKDDLGPDGIGLGCRPLGRAENPEPLINRDGKVRAGFEPN